jgi:quinol monooxygenase YgiN
MAQPFAVIVEAEIQPDRVDELLKIMENNARESRKEPGCLRFGTCHSPVPESG